MEAWITFAVIWPFIGAFLTWLCGLFGESAGKGRTGKKILCADCRRNIMAAVTVSVEVLLAAVLCLHPFLEKLPVSVDLQAGSAMAAAAAEWKGFGGMGLTFATDSFRLLYTLVAAFMWFVSALFSFSYMKEYEHKNRYYFFLLMTLGATVGVFLSGDFFTMFVFFEMMSLTSYMWVAQDERKESLLAAETYLAIAIIGGLCILMGMFLLYGETKTLSTLGDLRVFWQGAPTNGIRKGRLKAAGILMLLGFGAKAGVAPLHIWLPKAHPVAPAPASALLSGILTKTGVFGCMLLVLQLFAGSEAFGRLIFLLGLLTMVAGALLALFSVNLKRTLACSSVSQIGFIFTGLGMAGMFSGREMGEGFQSSLNGAILHMVNHSLLKLLLFCAAGVVYMNLHKLNLNDIRGFGRKKPLLNLLFLVGSLGLAGAPLFNAYVSKSLIHEGMTIWHENFGGLWMKGAEMLFLLSGGLTAAYMAKLYIVVFWEKNKDGALQASYEEKKTYMDGLSAFLLTITAVFIPTIGIGGGIMLKTFNMESLSGAFFSLAAGAAVYLLAVRKGMMKNGEYVDRWLPKWDLENRVYRPLLKGIVFGLCVILRLLDRLPDYIVVGLRKTVYRDAPLSHELEEGNVFTHAAGVLLDGVKKALNRTVCRKRPIEVSFEHRLAMLEKEQSENNVMIGRSLSFGLLLFCLGLLFTLLYMLLS